MKLWQAISPFCGFIIPSQITYGRECRLTATKIGQPPTATTNPCSQHRLADPFSFCYSAPGLIEYIAKALQLSSIFVLYPRLLSEVTYCGSHKLAERYFQLMFVATFTHVGMQNLISTVTAHIAHYSRSLLSFEARYRHCTSPSTYRPAPGQFTLPIMDIKLLIEPHNSKSPESKKSSVSVASVSTGETRVYTLHSTMA